MKKNGAILALIVCLLGSTSAFARGNYGGYREYPNSSHYSGYRSHSHHNDGLNVAVGVMGGLLLGSALMYSATPPPRAVVYGSPYTTYPQEVVVQQPKICVEERLVSGEWQISQYDGRQIWVSFPYPVTQRVQIPCY